MVIADILVIDDDLATRRLLVDVLVDAGYAVAAVPSPTKALRSLSAASATSLDAQASDREGTTSTLAAIAGLAPRLILLDGYLPGLDTASVMRALRVAYGRAVPILVLSHGEYPAEVEAERIADAAIRKPFDLDALLRLVAQLIP